MLAWERSRVRKRFILHVACRDPEGDLQVRARGEPDDRERKALQERGKAPAAAPATLQRSSLLAQVILPTTVPVLLAN